MARHAWTVKKIPEGLGRAPFTLGQAAELGLTPRVLEGPRFRSPLSGVRTLRDTPDTVRTRCLAASLVLPEEAVFSHDTAIHLGGWLSPRVGDGASRYTPREPAPGTPLHVTVPRGTPRPQRRGVIAHRSDLERGDVMEVAGLRITSPWRSWGDLATDGSEEDLVILADALRRRFGDGASQLAMKVEVSAGRRGAQTLRRALSRSRDEVDSPMETRLRLLFEDAGLPQPVVNGWVRREDGFPVHKPDLSWPEWKVAADYDGVHHADQDDDEDVRRGRASDWRRRQDRSRRDLLEEVGWILRIFTAFDVFSAPGPAIERMRTALSLAGAPV